MLVMVGCKQFLSIEPILFERLLLKKPKKVKKKWIIEKSDNKSEKSEISEKSEKVTKVAVLYMNQRPKKL